MMGLNRPIVSSSIPMRCFPIRMAGGEAGPQEFGSLMLMENPVLMIIKGLFRRYERWNPVHPTSGAFWGMGFGVGCGVGWGPGFGPEVIGYVGAGCGIGFSVGITLVGVGIGLPAHFLLQIPCKVVESARTGALEFCKSSALSVRRNETGFDWNPMNPFLSGLTKVAYGKHLSVSLPRFTSGFQLNEMKIHLTSQANSCLIRLGAFKDSFLARDEVKKGDPPP